MALRSRIVKAGLLLLSPIISELPATGQNEWMQFPSVLRNSYFEINVGYINYPFGQESMEPGFSLESVHVPHAAVRLVLFGHEFNRYLSAQITYLRPVWWTEYEYVNDKTLVRSHGTVWMNVAGLTVVPQLPVTERLSLYGELGACLVTRNGINDLYTYQTVIKDVTRMAFLFGGGIRYRANRNWGFMLSATYTPPDKVAKQPYTVFYAAGFSYKLLPITEKRLVRASYAGYSFPKEMIQVGYSTNLFGFGVNDVFSKMLLFWGGDVEVRHGLTLNYQRTIYRGIKVFSFDWGVSFSYWQSNLSRKHFVTVSLFPVLRFTVIRSKPVDVYFFYSVAGPTYISRRIIDGKDTGGNFTFQDNLGVGIYLREKRDLNLEVKIGHYSNGNLFPNNDGVKIPLTFSLGFPF